ncbi:hypothetical protein F7725_013261 [Dissostichus mawsoni]|uniref:CUE domain-containing protein n=1 Tax=Dissostichus mawsoni TaxID=36200 RepID=A0A7J5YS18_DISMA|nr:hypothetical protein F7725_013261 [Dissostichus mawsoni]
MACAQVPLDEQQVTEKGPLGKEQTLPALHPARKEDRFFVPYKSPPEDGSPAEVVFDETLQRCLDSYLHHAPRGLDLATMPSSPAVADMQRCVHRAVFLTFLRMATHKESKESFLTPSVFGEIIYENFLFDIPKFLDLCVLFGKGNSQLLHKMIENIFTNQPSYYVDLDETVPTVLQIFDTIMDKCGLHCEGAAAMEPMKLNAHKQPTAMTMSQQDLVDLVLYLCDSTTTIQAFLDIFPAACSSFHSHGFLSRLVSFYESAVPDLEKAVRKRNFDATGLQEDLWKRLSHSCRKIVEMAQLLLHHTCLQPILEGDETRTSYLLQGVQSAWDSVGRRRPHSHSQYQGAAGGAAEAREPERGGEGLRGAEAMVDAPRKGNNESLLTCIRDLLPDLGEGFLLACLKEYHYNSELVINNILEDRLAPSLDQLDRAMPRPVVEPLPDVLNVRSNVFDDDEFDVFRRDQVDMSRIWKGRRGERQRVAERQAAHSGAESSLPVLRDGGGRGGPGAWREPEAYGLDDYDDEYDDTYDMGQVGANDTDGDSLLSRRPFTVPQILRKGNKPEFVEEEEEEEEPLQNNVNRDQFVQDPALLRERAEARRADMHQRKGFRPEPRPNNVVGQPKGQGQKQETVVDRRKKEASKGRGANHNRRNMADRKRNKGMIPS